MQESTISQEKIARRNSPAYVRLRITGEYLFLYLLAFLLGILFCSLLDPASLPPAEQYTSAHFSVTPGDGIPMLDRACRILRDANGDIRAMLFILTAGFTMFCPLALSLHSVWRGFSLGFTAAYLCSAVEAGLTVPSRAPAAFLLFLGANVLIAASLVELSARAVIFSHMYRQQCIRPRMIFTSPFVRQYLFHYLTIFGFVLIVNFLYAALSSLLL